MVGHFAMETSATAFIIYIPVSICRKSSATAVTTKYRALKTKGLIEMTTFTDKPSEITKQEWLEKLENVHLQRTDMNRLVMNYLVTEGFKEAAEKFALEAGFKAPAELERLDERIKIRDAIQAGKIQEATALVNQLHPDLLDSDRYLFFHLQQQHLIELIRQKNIEEALRFAQEHLAERGEQNPAILGELERTLALLAFDDPEKSPFGDLLHPSHRQRVASELNAAILKAEHRESTTPQLVSLMKLVMWAQDQLDQRKVGAILSEYFSELVSGKS